MEKNIGFKVGDKVKIRKDSKYYGASWFSNPVDVLGEVNSIYPNSELPIRVEWSTGVLNCYRSCDLELVKDESPAQDGLDKEQPPKVDILAIRDRIYKIDEDLVTLRNERAGLVKDLLDEGFILNEKNSEHVDINDWRTWKIGDLVKASKDFGTLVEGTLYEITDMEDADCYDGILPIELNGEWWPEISIVLWISRPN